MLAFGVLEFCNIAMEILWTIFYAIIYLNDTYIFTVIVMMFLLGVGMGSAVGAKIVPHIQRPVFGLGVLQFISATWSLVMLLMVP